MTGRCVLALTLTPDDARSDARVEFSCPHGLVNLPHSADDQLAPVIESVLSIHDQFRDPACTGPAWEALRSGKLPVTGAAISRN